MSEERYCYKGKLGPHAAAWMHLAHGMRFISAHSGKEIDYFTIIFNAGSPIEKIREGQVYIIHPDSMHLLKPYVGDVVQNPDDLPALVIPDGQRADNCVSLSAAREFVGTCATIIQRDGKAFHMPEREDA